ncbi:uncharacterized protein LOC131149728 isoform X2 [Malania oleifera]|uniref:uncharacterized protein LOC131149728 isoform X2 n=1 Tax=Malania oleifera TaxID=397392 RepID=UPI0025ADE630|nr:uncharacterized protein LOC131149728 isoform X2 [Malania oleifera]XP_057956417.1 uncharacterized protein LOC131149728 isoform X2 [Malania oleifera]XP_057956418.1 uncharacterized protein LOC131149728 isoform X2 [Malania oleifera]
MSTKVDQTTVAITSSTSSPKVTMFGAKSGFVIPKNKLSGSLVPIFRGGKKAGGSDAADEESAKQVQRKTKWGLDLTQDAAVRRGKALAYQLKSGILETGDSQDSAAEVLDQESSGQQINSEKHKKLDLERREVIGEILKLNPSYKAPPDYKPVLKDARVPVPVKEYPGYNFIGLIFGPGNDTIKRLEKETGTRIQVYGTKADTGEKGEITASDGTEIQGAYEELYVHVSADTFEKVDAVVALVELLVTPVSGNPATVSTTSTSVSTDNTNVLNQSQGSLTPYTIPTTVANQGVVQPATGLAQNPPQSRFQLHPHPWIPTGPPHTPIHQASGFIPPPSSSVPVLNSPAHLAASPFSPPNLPPLFGASTAPAAGFGSAIQNQSLASSRPPQWMPVMRHPYIPFTGPLSQTGPPRIPSMPVPQPSPAQHTAPAVFTSGQNTQPAPPLSRPLMPSLHPLVSKHHQGMPPDRPITPAGSSSGWSGPAGAPSLGPTNAVHPPPPVVPLQGPRSVASQPVHASTAPANMSAPNIVPPLSFPSQPSGPHSSSTSANRPPAAPASSSLVPIPVQVPTPAPSQPPLPAMPMHAATARASVVNPSPNPPLGSTPLRLPTASTSSAPPVQSGIPGSVSGNLPSFTPLKPPPITAPRPPRSNSGDFTFQPVSTHSPASQAVPRPSSHPPTQSTHSKMMVQPMLTPQAPSFQPAMPGSAPPPVLQSFPRPPVSNPRGQPQTQVPPITFSGNRNAVSAPPRLPSFPVVPTTPVPRMRAMNPNNPTPQMPNLGGPFPPRPVNHMQPRQIYPAPVIRPEIAINQQFQNNPSFAPGKPASTPSGEQQIYDPFSPTSVSNQPQQVGNPTKARKQENDPEYEDLMASVGVR